MAWRSWSVNSLVRFSRMPTKYLMLAELSSIIEGINTLPGKGRRKPDHPASLSRLPLGVEHPHDPHYPHPMQSQADEHGEHGEHLLAVGGIARRGRRSILRPAASTRPYPGTGLGIPGGDRTAVGNPEDANP